MSSFKGIVIPSTDSLKIISTELTISDNGSYSVSILDKDIALADFSDYDKNVFDLEIKDITMSNLQKYQNIKFDSEVANLYNDQVEFLILYEQKNLKKNARAGKFTNNTEFNGNVFCFLKLKGSFVDFNNDMLDNYHFEINNFRRKKVKSRQAILVDPSEYYPIVQITISGNYKTKHFGTSNALVSQAGRTKSSTDDFSVAATSNPSLGNNFNPRASKYDAFSHHWGPVIFTRSDGGDLTMEDFHKFQIFNTNYSNNPDKKDWIFTAKERSTIWKKYNMINNLTYMNTYVDACYDDQFLNIRRGKELTDIYNNFFCSGLLSGEKAIRLAFGNQIPGSVDDILNKSKEVIPKSVIVSENINVVNAISYMIQFAVNSDDEIKYSLENFTTDQYAKLIINDDVKAYIEFHSITDVSKLNKSIRDLDKNLTTLSGSKSILKFLTETSVKVLNKKTYIKDSRNIIKDYMEEILNGEKWTFDWHIKDLDIDKYLYQLTNRKLFWERRMLDNIFMIVPYMKNMYDSGMMIITDSVKNANMKYNKRFIEEVLDCST
jgi:hypothetical protein